MKRFAIVTLVWMGLSLLVSPISLAQNTQINSEARVYAEAFLIGASAGEPHVARIFEDFPNHRDQMIEQLATAYKQGGESAVLSESEGLMYDIALAVTPYYLARSSGRDLIAMYRTTLTISRSLAETDPLRCTRFFLGTPMADGTPALDFNVVSVAPYAQRMNLVTNRIFVNADRRPVPVNREMANQSLQTVGAALAVELDQYSLSLVGQAIPIVTVDDHIKYCNGINVFFTEILQLPQDQSVNLFRSFVE